MTSDAPDPVTWWYHATYYGSLSGIAERGLLPELGGSGAIGQAGHRGHSRGKVFFTSSDGIRDWWGKALYIADVTMDPTIGGVPVVLRIFDDFDEEPEIDPAGEYPAWFVRHPIEPHLIEVWDGKQWVDVEDHDAVNPEVGLEPPEAPDPRDYDDEDEWAEAVARQEGADDEDRVYGGFRFDSALMPPPEALDD